MPFSTTEKRKLHLCQNVSLLDNCGCSVLSPYNYQDSFCIYLNKAKANIFLKLLLGLIPNKRCDRNGCQFL